MIGQKIEANIMLTNITVRMKSNVSSIRSISIYDILIVLVADHATMCMFLVENL